MTVPSTISCTLLAAVLAGCCSPKQPALRDLDYPGTLQDPTRLATEAVWQQRVTATWHPPGQEAQVRGFDAALQRQDEVLTVIGLSPLGTVGFSIQQSIDGTEVVNNIEDQLVIPPRFILLDVQRTFFPWPCPQWTAPPGDGTRTGQFAQEEITETWQDGLLQQRTFRRLDDQPSGTITVIYDWQKPGWAVPTRAVLDNSWFGYQLTITTTSETRLSGDSRPAEGSS